MNNLKLRRLTAGRTQPEEAKRARISVTALRELEAGRAIPSPRVSKLLKAAYKVPVAELLAPVGEGSTTKANV